MRKLIVLLTILSMQILLVGCDINSPLSSHRSVNETKEVLSYNEILELNTLSILNGAGTINISESTTDEIEIECLAVYDGESKSDFEQKIKNITLTPTIIEDIIYLEVTTEDGTNYWEWLDSELDVDYIKVDFDIKLPSYIEDVRIVNVVGEMEIRDIETSLILETYVGNINCEDVAPIGNSHINVSTGNIDFHAIDISNAHTILNSVGLGNIVCKLPQDADYITDNKSVLDTTFVVDKDNMFSDEILQNYRDVLTKSDDDVNGEVTETVIGNKVGFGRVNLK